MSGGPTTWATIEAALAAWFHTVSGLTPQWSNQPRSARMMTGEGRGELEAPDVIHQLGEDWIERTPTDADPNILIETQVGNRVFTVGVRVVSLDQRSAFAARQTLEKLRGSLKLSATLSAFQAAGLAIVRAGPTKNMDAPSDLEDRMESRAWFPLELACVMAWQDPALTGVGTIGSVELTSNVAGTTPPDLDHEILTPP